MFRSSSVPPSSSRFVASILFAGAFFAAESSFAAKYEIRALTKDKVISFAGNAKQGSFGAPTLNDKGSIAYPCILFGNNVDAFTNTSIVYQKKGKKKKAATPATAVQAGYILDNSFLPTYNEDNTYGIPDSARVYKISKAIAINNKDQIGFSAEVLNEVRTDTFQDGKWTNAAYRPDDRSDYGVVFPSATAPGGFQDVCVFLFDNYYAEVLQRTLSINSNGSVPENATFKLTPTHTVPGFSYYYPTSLASFSYTDPSLPPNPDTTKDPPVLDPTEPLNPVSYEYYLSAGALVATTESNVIGLPYETLFSSFSDVLIADNNRAFIVADISDTGDEFDGIWQGTNPNLQPIVVKQTDAPGGGRFTSFDGKIGPNRKGTAAAFIANLTGAPSFRGVFRSNLNGKDVRLIASVGGKAPGTTGVFLDFELAAVNNRGSVAILGTVTGGTTGTGLAGIWVSDPTGKNLKLVVVSGQNIQIGKKTKKVTRIAFNPVAAMNKKAQVAFTASFTDKTSAVIVATP